MTETILPVSQNMPETVSRTVQGYEQFRPIESGEDWKKYHDPENFNKLVLAIRNKGVLERYSNVNPLPSDLQSGPVAESDIPEDDTWAQRVVVVSPVDIWDRLSNESLSVDDRVKALFECMDEDEDRAASFVAEELLREGAAGEWRDVLVFAASNLQFEDADQRDKLWRKLLTIAAERRQGSDPNAKVVTHAAIRRLGAMIPVEELSLLVPLLEPPVLVETRLVTLQRIGCAFEFAPPLDETDLSVLSQRVRELASTFINRDQLTTGQQAAIGLNVILALAYLGDENLPEQVQATIRLDFCWFSQLLLRKMDAMREIWKSQPEATSMPAFNRLDKSIECLETSLAK